MMSKIPTENSPNLRNDVIDACQVASGGFCRQLLGCRRFLRYILPINKFKFRSPCRNNNGFLDGLESYYVRNYGGTHNDYSGPESDGSDVDNGSCGRSSPDPSYDNDYVFRVMLDGESIGGRGVGNSCGRSSPIHYGSGACSVDSNGDVSTSNMDYSYGIQ